MKLYQINKISSGDPFRYIVIGSFAGITCKNWHCLKNTISKDFNNILFIHVEDKLFSAKTGSQSKNSFVLNSRSEFIDFYRISGVKHLLFVCLEELTFGNHNVSGEILSSYIKKSETVWIDASLHSFLDKSSGDDRFIVLPQSFNDPGIICKLLDKGMVKEAAAELGYLYQVRGKVYYGNSLGRKLGYPTANILPDDYRKKIPAKGVYTALIHTDSQWNKCMMNIGVRPTLNKSGLTIEAHIFDFENKIYDKNVSVHMVDKLRDEKRFPTLISLKNQIINDEKKALNVLKNIEDNIDVKGEFCFI